MRWTTEQDQVLKQKWNDEGWSARQIGNHLGFSRNAVIGRARRMKLNPREPRQPSRNRLEPTERRIVFKKLPPMQKPLVFRTMLTGGCTLFELKPTSCRWPVTDKLFCGEERLVGSPYCQQHYKRSVQKQTWSLSSRPIWRRR
jgi:GcrA cell cycle regulator